MFGGLHDSELRCVARDQGGSVQLVFWATDGTEVTLTARSESRPNVWSEGTLFPIIVARLSFYKASGRLPDDVKLCAASRARLELVLRSSSFEWLIVVEPSLGDMIVIVGSGDGREQISWRRS